MIVKFFQIANDVQQIKIILFRQDSLDDRYEDDDDDDT